MKIVVTSRSGTPDDDLRQEVEAVDQALRQSFSGLDTEVVEAEIDRAFSHLDVTPTPEDVAAYARAISERVDFELVVD